MLDETCERLISQRHLFSEEQERYQNEDRNENRQRELKDVAEEARRMHFGVTRDRLDHEVWTIPDVGKRAKEGRSKRNGHKDSLVFPDEQRHLPRVFQLEAMQTKRTSEEGQIRGGIIEERGENSAKPKELSLRVES